MDWRWSTWTITDYVVDDDMKLYRAKQLFGPHGITGLGRSSFYTAVKAGSFPAPVRISERSVAWRAEDVEVWIASRPVRESEIA